MTKEEALTLALEALEQLQGGCTDHDDGTVEAITVWCPEVIDAIKEALAQPEQEPVVWMYQDKSTHEVKFQKHMRGFVDHGATYETPLYTSPPPQRTWVGLTEQDIDIAFDDTQEGGGFDDFAQAIEAKLKAVNGFLKEKNT